ncbi:MULTISPECIES: hypothetical protein [Arthrobacter]|uniref:DUF485 domain-containing protein n=1 Tax=Arthrobacter humicola TaxID=409291 RepID=A0ABP5KHF4_9MICC|nr:hypothetical protein [Arthrobacter sp. H-02-3]PVZ53324.1 hypothetical protein C9424_17900 [Arthrobacter sp. H-02-3]
MTRVRVTAPRSLRPTAVLTGGRSAAALREAAEESDAGQLFVRSLIRSQLRLALVVALGFLLILLAFPLMLGLVPGLADSTIAGLPFDWVLLGAGIYPVIGLSAWLYVRTAARNEARYRDLAGDK